MDIGVIEEIVNSIKEEPQDTNTIYSAEVAYIDSEGRPWVYLAGSTKETPVERASAEVKSGDYVNVEWRNNKLYIAGNYSNPSAGVTRVVHVEQTADQAQADATAASSAASAASEAASSAVQSAATAAEAAETATNSLKSVVSGATTVEKAVSVMQTALEAVVDYDPSTDTTKEYFWHDANGAHVLGTSGAYRNDITSNGMQIVDTASEESVAEFSGNGISFYDNEGDNRHKTFSVDSTGSVIYTEVIETSAAITTASSPVTHVLSHKPSTSQGHNSFGFACPSGNNPAYYLNAGNPITFQWGYRGVNDGVIEYDGDITCTITPPSSLGTDTVTARFYYEYEIVAPSYDIGTRDGAAGKYSAVIGEDLQAIGNNCVAVGKYNDDPHGGMLFSIGNGTADNARSNAMFVDFLGNVKAAGNIVDGSGNALSDAVFPDASGNITASGEITDGGGNVLSDKADAASIVTPDDYVTAHGTSGSWRYRKWHSGKIEAWFEGTFSCAASTTARGSLYYSTWSLTIPSAIGFTATPNTLIGNTGDSNTVIAVNGAATSKTAMSGKVWRYASSSSALTISAKIYAWQN